MPFTNKFTHLGHTERIRLPATIVPYVGHIASELDRICGTHGEERVGHILEGILNGLQDL